MIRAFTSQNGQLQLLPDSLREVLAREWVWIDLVEPTTDEEDALEKILGIDIPTQEEMSEIEMSNRLYRELGSNFMTATVLTRVELEHSESAPLTFVITNGRLITVRYASVRPLDLYVTRACKYDSGIQRGLDVMLGILESIINRTADALEHVASKIDATSRAVLNPTDDHSADPDYQTHIRRIGQMGDLASRCRESLVSINRLISFFTATIEEERVGREVRARARAVASDTQSLTDHASFLANKLNFLLDATLGMLSIEQNSIIKIFSVAAVIFLPPTLVASIYGMNFSFMPELRWHLGYPWALGLMLVSAVLPFWYFKRRRWL